MTVVWRTLVRGWDSCFVRKGFFKIGYPDTTGILCVLNVLKTLDQSSKPETGVPLSSLCGSQKQSRYIITGFALLDPC